jgi:hypothetical protein
MVAHCLSCCVIWRLEELDLTNLSPILIGDSRLTISYRSRAHRGLPGSAQPIDYLACYCNFTRPSAKYRLPDFKCISIC